MKYRIKQYPEYEELVSQMTDDELIRTVVCPFIANERSRIYQNVVAEFFHPAKDEVLLERIRKAKEGQTLPMLLVTDVEGGAGFLEHGTKFTSMRGCGEADDENLAYQMGKISALETRKLGFNWGLGPCVDILNNVDNPVTYNRTVGRGVDRIIKYSKAVIKGMQENGLIAAAKHFPGDGCGPYDQHLTTSVNPLSAAEWRSTYGKIYQELIDFGVKSIMPGHISLPALDELDEDTGAYRPATLSKRLLTDVLKGELGFEGIIVSDAVAMGGFCGYMNYYHACAQFLMAGGDVLLFALPDEQFMEEMHKLIAEGALTREVLENRAYRMLCFAKENEQTAVVADYDPAAHCAIATECAEQRLEVERDSYHLLPFEKKSGLNILYNIISWNGHRPFDDEMVAELQKHADHIEVICDAGPLTTCRKIKENHYDLIVCRVAPQLSYGVNSARLSGPIARNMMEGWQKYGTPVIFITDSTSLSSEYEVVIDTLINMHGDEGSGYPNRMAEIVVRKIFGEHE